MSDLYKGTEGLEEKLVDEEYRKEKIKYRNPAGKTSKKARIEARDNAKNNIREDNSKVLLHDLEHLKNHVKEMSDKPSEQEKLITRYESWVKQNYPSQQLVLSDKEIERKYIRSGGEGGQRTNKKSTAVVCTHTISMIFARNEDTPDQFTNEERSRSELYKKISAHLGRWSILMETVPLTERDNKLKNYVRMFLI